MRNQGETLAHSVTLQDKNGFLYVKTENEMKFSLLTEFSKSSVFSDLRPRLCVDKRLKCIDNAFNRIHVDKALLTLVASPPSPLSFYNY